MSETRKKGLELFDGPRKLLHFTRHDEADRLLNDLDNYPHAYVLASIMDRQIKAERAWLIPFRLAEKLGSFTMDTLVKLSQADIRNLMAAPEPLHRFVEKMATFFYKGVRRIAERYNGDASQTGQANHPVRLLFIDSWSLMGLGRKSPVWMRTFWLGSSR